jgi:hypothetical protein
MEVGQRYFSYLLRVWLVGNSHTPQWRASLEDPFSGERNGFASLEALFGYLHQQIGPDCGRKADHPKREKIMRLHILKTSRIFQEKGRRK